MEDVGVVGSPSTTAKVTVDILEDAVGAPLHGQLVALSHPLDKKCLIALGTVTEIRTANRWHEDPNMRGVLKRHGSLPHLSDVGDVRTADVLIQAAYLAEASDPSQGDPPLEHGAALSMSPTTGASVSRVSDKFLEDLLRRHTAEIVYLGKIYRTDDVKLPLTIRDFGAVKDGGAGEAYHTGIFGMTGSGKSVFASYLIAAQLRHPNLAILIMDPQGQFTSEEGLPFSLHEWAKRLGRKVLMYSISSDLRLDQDAFLLADLLGLTRFFRDVLTLKGEENRDSAVAEIRRLLQGPKCKGWNELSPDDVLRTVLTDLVADQPALTRIYSSTASRTRLQGILTAIVTDGAQFELAAEPFRALHSLFTKKNLEGGERKSLYFVLEQILEEGKQRPFVVIDLSAGGGTGELNELLNSSAVKARILRLICSRLNNRAENLYRAGKSLNTLVVFDEAQRFAAESPEDDESSQLAEKLVDYVHTTRKYGLGWTFITQEVGSLKRGIYTQLRVRCFGYGLTSGTELTRLRETLGDASALTLYHSFVDPGAVKPSQYPFMLTGPVSPLSFTGAPVFLSVYTEFERFTAENGFSGA